MDLPALKIEEFAVEERERLARLEEKTGNIEKNLSRVEGKVDRLETKVDGVKDSVAALSLAMEKGFSKLSHQMIWLYVGLGVGLLGIITRAFHWV